MTVAARGEVDFAATRYGRFWHAADMPTASRNVRSQGQSGKHLLVLSFSGFDPLSEVWRFVADGFVLQRPIASVERAPYHKARLIQINAALIRANFHAGGCEEFMKVHAIQAGSDRGPGAWPAATPATILLGRFEKAHPIDPAQRAQHVKAGFPSRMERR